MEVNKAAWKRAYPRRALTKRDKTQADAAVAAMAEDLRGVLDTIESVGLWLDDHYLEARQIISKQMSDGRS